MCGESQSVDKRLRLFAPVADVTAAVAIWQFRKQLFKFLRDLRAIVGFDCAAAIAMVQQNV